MKLLLIKAIGLMLPLVLWMGTASAYVSSVNYQNKQFNQRYQYQKYQFNNRANGFNNRQFRHPNRQYPQGYRHHRGYRAHPYHRARPYQYRGHQYRHAPRTYPNRVYRGGTPGGFRH